MELHVQVYMYRTFCFCQNFLIWEWTNLIIYNKMLSKATKLCNIKIVQGMKWQLNFVLCNFSSISHTCVLYHNFYSELIQLWNQVYNLYMLSQVTTSNYGLIPHVFSKFSQNCSSCKVTREILGKTLKIHVKLILNFPRTLEITCLSHNGQNVLGNCIHRWCAHNEALSALPQLSKQM